MAAERWFAMPAGLIPKWHRLQPRSHARTICQLDVTDLNRRSLIKRVRSKPPVHAFVCLLCQPTRQPATTPTTKETNGA